MIGGERRASKQVARMARELQESLAGIRSHGTTPQATRVSPHKISVFRTAFRITCFAGFGAGLATISG